MAMDQVKKLLALQNMFNVVLCLFYIYDGQFSMSEDSRKSEKAV